MDFLGDVGIYTLIGVIFVIGLILLWFAKVVK